MNICRRTFIVARLLAAMLFFSHSFCHAAFVLKNCFPNRANYAIDWSYDLSPADNAQGKLVSAGVLVGNGPHSPLTANVQQQSAAAPRYLTLSMSPHRFKPGRRQGMAI